MKWIFVAVRINARNSPASASRATLTGNGIVGNVGAKKRGSLRGNGIEAKPPPHYFNISCVNTSNSLHPLRGRRDK